MSALVDVLSDVVDTVTATGRGSRPDSTTPGWRLSCIHRPREEAACSESGRQIGPSSLREDAPCRDGGARRPFPGRLWHGASTRVSAPLVRRGRADQATRARLREARDDRALLRPGENHPPTQLLEAGRAFNALFTLPR